MVGVVLPVYAGHTFRRSLLGSNETARTGRLGGVFVVSLIGSLALPLATNAASGSLTRFAACYSWLVWAITILLGVSLGIAEVCDQVRFLRRRPPNADQLTAAVRQLRLEVRAQRGAEAVARQIRRLDPLMVTWSSTTPASWRTTTHPARILDDHALEGRRRYLRVAGDLDDLADLWRWLPHRQLVIIGPPGSGKTTALLSLVLSMLNTDSAGQLPLVPMLFGVGSWNPSRHGLHSWLAEQAVEQYRFLADRESYGVDPMQALLAEGRLLVVLDGLDEMPDHLRGIAMRKLDDALSTGAALILSCRTEEYLAEVGEIGRTSGNAAVVELEPIGLENATIYLTGAQLTTDDRWRDTVARLRADPSGPAAAALSRPLLTWLCWAVYQDRSRDPAELVDLARFPDQARLEDHLLDAFVPAMYERPDGGRYLPDRARRWLVFLARHLTRLGTYDLRWWDLYRRPSFVELCLVLGVGLNIVGPAITIFTFGVIPSQVGTVTGAKVGYDGAAIALSWHFTDVLGALLIHLALAPLGVPVTDGLRRRPRTIRLSPPRPLMQALWIGVRRGMLFAALVGAALDLAVVIGVVTQALSTDPPVHGTQIAGLPFGLFVTTLIAGASLGLVVAAVLAAQGTPGPLARSASPLSSLRRAKWAAGGVGMLATFVACGPLPLGITGIVLTTVGELVLAGRIDWASLRTFSLFGVILGSVLALVVLPYIIVVSRWLRFRLIVAYYAMLGRVPWRFMRFLRDAHDRGILRQEGAVYQFRHARVQDRLAAPRRSAVRLEVGPDFHRLHPRR